MFTRDVYHGRGGTVIAREPAVRAPAVREAFGGQPPPVDEDDD